MLRNGEIIKGTRILRGLSQQQLADKVGVSAPTIYRIEADRPNVEIETVGAAAKALGLDFNWLDRSVQLPEDYSAEVIEQVVGARRRGPRSAANGDTRTLELPADLYADLEKFSGGDIVGFIREAIEDARPVPKLAAMENPTSKRDRERKREKGRG